MECQHLPGGNNSRAVVWRNSLCGLPWPFCRLCGCTADSNWRDGFVVSHQARGEGAPREPITFKTVFAGLHYIGKKKLILGAISLDLFAVLLGGAVALLPVYAREILHTGPWGLGLLRTAPGVGAA